MGAFRPVLELKDSLEQPFFPPESPQYAHSPGPFEVPGLWRILGETLWWWVQSPANTSLPNSLFNRENTGNFFIFEGLYPPYLIDFPAVKGFQEFIIKNGTGNNREMD